MKREEGKMKNEDQEFLPPRRTKEHEGEENAFSAPRTGQAKAWPHLFNLGAFTELRALLRLMPKRGTVIMGHHWR
jgi:hypothetical protein